ncbi:DDE-type integrase/transposase/recombinase (plasmid) [Serratia fonticola]
MVFSKKQTLLQRPLAECPPETLPKRLRPYLLEFGEDGEPTGLNAGRYEFWLYRQIRKRFQAGEFHLNNSLRHRHLSDELVPEGEQAAVLAEPTVITIDKSGANTAALAALNADKPEEETITIRQSKYLNNLVEQDHRNIKRRTRSMLGFKSFRRAQTIQASIELLNMIRKGQYQHPQSERVLSPAEQFYLLAA